MCSDKAHQLEWSCSGLWGFVLVLVVCLFFFFSQAWGFFETASTQKELDFVLLVVDLTHIFHVWLSSGLSVIIHRSWLLILAYIHPPKYHFLLSSAVAYLQAQRSNSSHAEWENRGMEPRSCEKQHRGFFAMVWPHGPALQSLRKVQIREQDGEGSALV